MNEKSRKLFYSIGEVSEIFQVNESTLRFWEKEFPTTIRPRKNARGVRMYTTDDIENIRLVYFLVKGKGMTLAGARKRLKEEKKTITAQFELAERLHKIRSELLLMQQELGVPKDEAEVPMPEETVASRLYFPPRDEAETTQVAVSPVPDDSPVPEVAEEASGVFDLTEEGDAWQDESTITAEEAGDELPVEVAVFEEPDEAPDIEDFGTDEPEEPDEVPDVEDFGTEEPDEPDEKLDIEDFGTDEPDQPEAAPESKENSAGSRLVGDEYTLF